MQYPKSVGALKKALSKSFFFVCVWGGGGGSGNKYLKSVMTEFPSYLQTSGPHTEKTSEVNPACLTWLFVMGSRKCINLFTNITL